MLFRSQVTIDLPAQLLVDNPLDRYLINSTMLDTLKRDAEGGITLYLQSTSPGKGKESIWLPTPKGPFFAVLRNYWPDPIVVEGKWQAPKLQRAQ